MTNQRIVFLFLSYLLASTVIASTIDQSTEGWCSPAINDTKGNIIVNCHGISPKIAKRLEELLDRKDLELDQKNLDLFKAQEEIDHWLKKYNELKTELGSRPETDELAAKARQLLDDGDLEAAEAAMKESFTQKLENIDQLSEAAARDANDLGSIKELQLAYLEALEYYETAVRLQPDNALYLNGAGKIHHTLANHKKAINYLGRVLASHLKTYGENHPDVATSRNNLGTAWNSLGEYRKAIKYLELALASNLKSYGEDHPHVATARNNLGAVWRQLREYHKAIEYFELALASGLKTYGEDHPHVATYRNNLGMAWNSLGEYHKAIEYYELALASCLKTYGEDHPRTQSTRASLDEARTALSQSQKD